MATKEGGGCPVRSNSSSGGETSATPGAQQGGWLGRWFGFGRGQAPTQDTAGAEKKGGCPVSGDASPVAGPLNPLNNERLYSQQPTSHQKSALSTERQVSSIPKSDFTPKHQPEGTEKWVYPSEQQYFNAMKSKGYSVREGDVGLVLAIHNAVNEEGWKKVLEWEREYDPEPPKLKKFMGRPRDLSPKAWLMTMMGYAAPFDRHDWTVERKDGTQVRYVIDFYAGAAQPDKPIAIHMDVRPALDSVGALADRLAHQWREAKASILEDVMSSFGGPSPPSDRPTSAATDTPKPAAP